MLSQIYHRYNGPSYRDNGLATRTYEGSDNSFIISDSAESESDTDRGEETRVKKTPSKRRKTQISSSEEEPETSQAGKNTSSDGDDEEEDEKGEITPRRSKRKRPDRHSLKVAKSLRKLEASKRGKRASSTSSDESGEDAEENKSNPSTSDDLDKSPEKPRDAFVKYCTQVAREDKPVRKKSQIVQDSQEAGPSSAGYEANGSVPKGDENAAVETSLDTPAPCNDQDDKEEKDGDQVQDDKKEKDDVLVQDAKDDKDSDEDQDNQDLTQILWFVLIMLP